VSLTYAGVHAGFYGVINDNKNNNNNISSKQWKKKQTKIHTHYRRCTTTNKLETY